MPTTLRSADFQVYAPPPQVTGGVGAAGWRSSPERKAAREAQSAWGDVLGEIPLRFITGHGVAGKCQGPWCAFCQSPISLCLNATRRAGRCATAAVISKNSRVEAEEAAQEASGGGRSRAGGGAARSTRSSSRTPTPPSILDAACSVTPTPPPRAKPARATSSSHGTGGGGGGGGGPGTSRASSCTPSPYGERSASRVGVGHGCESPCSIVLTPRSRRAGWISGSSVTDDFLSQKSCALPSAVILRQFDGSGSPAEVEEKALAVQRRNARLAAVEEQCHTWRQKAARVARGRRRKSAVCDGTEVESELDQLRAQQGRLQESAEDASSAMAPSPVPARRPRFQGVGLRAARMRALSNKRTEKQRLQVLAETQGRAGGVHAVATDTLAREVSRLDAERIRRDLLAVSRAFTRYDEDGSGTLSLNEVRALLIDLGLCPRSVEEKARVRRVLVDMARGLPEPQGHLEEEVTLPCSAAERVTQEKLARGAVIDEEDLPLFISRVRAAMKVCRTKSSTELFHRFDIFHTGMLNLSAVLRLLEDLGLLPEGPEETRSFCEHLLQIGDKDESSNAMEAPPPSRIPSSSRPQSSNGGAPPISRTSTNLLEALPPQSRSPSAAALVSRTSTRLLEAMPASQSRRPSISNMVSKTSSMLLVEPLSLPTRRASMSTLVSRTSTRLLEASPQGRTHSAAFSVLSRSRSLSKSAEDPLTSLPVFEKENRKLIFNVQSFELIMELCSQAKELRQAGEQWSTASRTGVTSLKLFLEFRQELSSLWGRLQRCSEDEEPVDKTAALVALTSLGLCRNNEEKVWVMRLLNEACVENPSRAAPGEMGVLEERSSPLASFLGAYLPGWDVLGKPSTIEFQSFLEIISTVRVGLQKATTEELKPIFEYYARQQRTGLDGVLGTGEIFKALHDLNLVPSTREEQLVIGQLLDDANEFGFEPPALSFDAFVRFVRCVREWKAGSERERAWNFGVRELGLPERLADESRLAFDALVPRRRSPRSLWQLYWGRQDEFGREDERIHASAARQALRALGWEMSSMKLRELYRLCSMDYKSRIVFEDFLRLVQLCHDRGEELLRPPAPMPPEAEP